MSVVIISASLLSLAFYGRLAAVVSRLRGFQREILREQGKPRRSGRLEQVRLLELLRKQIRLALMFFLTAVAFLIVRSLALMLSRLRHEAAFLPRICLRWACYRCLAASSRR